MALPEEPAKVHVDSWGLKRCFTHCLRRWLAGTVAPRVTQQELLFSNSPYFQLTLSQFADKASLSQHSIPSGFFLFCPDHFEALQKLSLKMHLQNVSPFTQKQMLVEHPFHLAEDASLQPVWDAFDGAWGQPANHGGPGAALDDDDGNGRGIAAVAAIEDGAVDSPVPSPSPPASPALGGDGDEDSSITTTQPEQTTENGEDMYADYFARCGEVGCVVKTNLSTIGNVSCVVNL